MKTRRDYDNRGRPINEPEQNPNHWTIERIRYLAGGVMIRYQSARKEDPGARYILEFSADELDLILSNHKAGRQAEADELLLGPPKRGPKRKLDEDEVDRIRFMYETTSCSMDRLGTHFGVSQGVIQHVLDRKGAYA